MLYEPGSPVIPRPLNVATPLDAVAVSVEVFDPRTVPLERVAVTVFAAEVTLLLPASRISMTGCVVNASLYAAPLACVVMASLIAAPTPTVKLFDVAEPRLEVVNVSV